MSEKVINGQIHDFLKVLGSVTSCLDDWGVVLGAFHVQKSFVCWRPHDRPVSHPH